MTTSETGLKLIESFEALRLTAYKPTPQDVWTIGYGHTDGVKEGDTCTNEQAEQWLDEDIRVAELAIDTRVTVTLNQNQYDALVSFTFNVGTEAFETSTLLKLLNAGDTMGAGIQFLVWTRQAGKVLQGLLNRRKKEQSLFLTPMAAGV